MNNEYYSCDIIEYGFDAQISSLNLCCRISGDHLGESHKLIPNYSGEKIDWEKFFEKKQKIRDIHKNGEVFELCSGCLYLTKEEWDDSNYIRTININNWIKCNADCIYCDRSTYKKVKEYKIFPVFKDMIDKKLLKAGGPITISGGEPSIIREFDSLLNLFLKNDLYNIKVLTNGIKYNRAIEKGLKKGAVNILISTDSGTKETYKKVKRVDKHSQVWKNVKKYVSQAKSPTLVKTKFIVIPGINNTQDEILEFLKLNFQNGVKHAEIDLEIGWFYSHREEKTNFDKIYQLYQFAVEKAKELDIFLEAKDRMILLLQDLEH